VCALVACSFQKVESSYNNMKSKILNKTKCPTKYDFFPLSKQSTNSIGFQVTCLHTSRGAARIFLRGGAEVMEAKALKRKNCL